MGRIIGEERVQEISVKDQLLSMIDSAVREARLQGELRSVQNPKIVLETPKQEELGDYASSVALGLARVEGRPPRELAELLIRHLKDDHAILTRVEVAGPGYINFLLKPDCWQRLLPIIVSSGTGFGRVAAGKGKSIQVEFVSANPTGPLHVGHGRWAAVGHALANLLTAAGHKVQKEYYNNDAGRQVKLLGRSVYARYQQLLGHPVPDPEDGYRGEYIVQLAQLLIDRFGKIHEGRGEEECLEFFTKRAVEVMSGLIREDLESFGITFDSWFGEATLFESGAVRDALETLQKNDHLFEKDGALWFRSTAFGDDKDRVVRKEDGEFTYLASDIAYHRDKLKRGFDLLIDIWGADHHGYTARMEAVVQALGYPRDRLRILIGQLVSLLRNGQPVAMSKRAGEFVTMRDVVNEVGRDAAIFFFLMRRLDTHLDFDLELAKRRSDENPVYYVQYAHARLASVLRQAAQQGIALEEPDRVSTARLDQAEEIRLMKRLASYPELIEESARSLEPHRLTFFLLELAGVLHHYYFKHRIISPDAELTQARLLLVRAVKTVMGGALDILAVSAPERM